MPKTGKYVRRRKDGRWEGRCPMCYDENNKIKYISLYAKTCGELKEKVQHYQLEHPFTYRKNLNKTMSFYELTSLYLQSVRKNLKESSYSLYKRRCDKHILPFFGSMKCHKITVETVQEFLDYKASMDLSQSSISGIRTTLMAILHYGFTNYSLNYFELPKQLKKKELKTIPVMEESDVLKFISYLSNQNSRSALGILLCLCTGLRIGEVCALRMKDINTVQGLLTVEMTMGRVSIPDSRVGSKTKIVFSKPKSTCSNRIIPIPPILLQKLKELPNRPNDFFLTGSEEKFIEPRRLQNHYTKYLKDVGIPYMKFHSLRHTFASRSIEAGFDVKSLSEILGHYNVAFTMAYYVHPSMNAKRNQMARLESITFAKSGKKMGQDFANVCNI
ncbi:putative phage integrase/recombinase [Lachnospiraceae bacterium TWA4]|nr:putative phage integrase/recombinase [Lachnospiraceae bacterium TWA4]